MGNVNSAAEPNVNGPMRTTVANFAEAKLGITVGDGPAKFGSVGATLLVTGVQENGQKAGARVGMIVVAVNGVPVSELGITNHNEFSKHIAGSCTSRPLQLSMEEPIDGEPLCTAAFEGDVATVLKLLEAGLPVDFRDSANRRTPLMKAAMQGRAEAVKLLLERGATPILQDSAGKSALDWAIENGHADVVTALGGDAQRQDELTDEEIKRAQQNFEFAEEAKRQRQRQANQGSGDNSWLTHGGTEITIEGSLF